MKMLLSVLAALALSSPASAEPAAGRRLIELSPSERVWMDSSNLMRLKRYFHEKEGICGGFMDVTDHASIRPEPVLRKLVKRGRRATEHGLVRQLLPRLEAGSLISFVERLSAFQNRRHNSRHGVAAAEYLHSQYAEFARGRDDIEVVYFKHRFMQPSVIARIRGAKKPEEKVILGGHLDSIAGGGSEGRAPGADDDASGTATNLEVFRVLAASGTRPDRTIEFMAYAGEEAGLLGSQDIANDYRKRNEKVAAVLQLDMTLYPGQGRKMTFITDHTDGDLTKFTEGLAGTYMSEATQRSKCGYACSDHASWTKAGYPAVFPFEADFREYNRAIHSDRDVIGNTLDPEFGLRFAKIALAFAVELGYGP